MTPFFIQLSEFYTRFFILMGVEVTSLVVDGKEGDTVDVMVRLQTPDSKLLIGIHGQTLSTLQSLLTRMTEQSFDVRIILHLDVNDYIREKSERFYRYIDSRVAIVEQSGREIRIPNLSAFERKQAHDHIHDRYPHISTHSEGEGADRVMCIALKNPTSPRLGVVVPTSIISEEGVGI